MSSAIENACTPFFQVHILHGNDAKDDDDDDDDDVLVVLVSVMVMATF